MIDLNNIKLNVLVHTGGRCGSHRFADLLLNNNELLSIALPGDRHTRPCYEYHNVPEWSNAKHIMIQDLKSINDSGKYWIIKTGANPNAVEHITANFQNYVEIGLIRESLLETAISYAVGTITSDWHVLDKMPDSEDDDTLIKGLTSDIEKLNWIADSVVFRTLTYNYSILALQNIRQFPILTYESLRDEPHKMFNDISNDTYFTVKEVFTTPRKRLITPHNKLKELMREVIKKKIDQKHVDTLNQLAPSNIEFR